MEKMRKDVKEAGWFARASVVLALVALVVACVGSLTSLLVAKRDSHHAAKLALIAAQSAKTNRINADAKRAILHQQDLKSCKSRHVLTRAFIRFLNGNIGRQEKLLNTPGALKGLPPQIVRNARKSLAESMLLLSDLHAADCDPKNPKDVLPLNTAGG